MPTFSVGNWIRENSSTTGTGPLTLTGAVGNNPTLLDVFGSGVTNDIVYSLKDNGVEVETGVGSYNSAGSVFTRGPIATWDGATYNASSPPAANLVGPVELRITLNAEQYKSIVEEAPIDDRFWVRENGGWSNIPIGFIAHWNFDSNTIAADPGSGNVRLNTGAFATATAMYISSETGSGINLNTLIEVLGSGEPMLIYETERNARAALYELSGDPIPNVAMPATTWWNFPLTFVDEGSGGFLRNNRQVAVQFFGFSVAGGVPEAPDDVYPYARKGNPSDEWVKSVELHGPSAVDPGDTTPGNIWFDNS